MKKRRKLLIAGMSLLLCLLFIIPAMAAETDDTSAANDVAVLQEMLDQIQQRALNPVEKQKLIDGALKGMIDALGDEHSMYFNPEQTEFFERHIQGAFGGIGVIMTKRPEGITVIKILEDMAAEDSNIQKGDIIVAVDGQDVKDMSLDEAAELIRGEIGTDVVLTILHSDSNQEDITLTRCKIEISPIYDEMLDNGIGYVRIDNFSANTKKNFKKVLNELQESELKGLILDLRDNPGGLLTAGLDVASVLTPEGKLLTVQGRDGEEINAYQSLIPSAVDVPLVVLINENSASASEIVTGAVKDYGTGTIVGKTSYGKATMQQVVPLSNGGEMKVTYAHYLTPNGNMIDGKGITPDVLVEDTRGNDNKIAYELKALLSYGSRGEAVQVLQQYLNELGFNVGKADGIFGGKTLQAVKKMQQAYWHTVNGEVDQAVMNELIKHLPGQKMIDAQLDKAIEIIKEKNAAKPAA